MGIAYVISIIVAYCQIEKVEKKTRERLEQDGYVEVKDKSFTANVASYIGTAVVLMIPFLNFIAPAYANAHFDKYYKDAFNDWVKDGTIKKIEEVNNEEDLYRESGDHLKIDNILTAKSLKEENMPRWKKEIECIYYEIGNFLKENKIIESNQKEYHDETINDHNKTKKL